MNAHANNATISPELCEARYGLVHFNSIFEPQANVTIKPQREAALRKSINENDHLQALVSKTFKAHSLFK